MTTDERARRVLVAGASGLVGTAAARAFLAAGWEVIALSRRAPVLVEHPRLNWIALDLEDAARCAAAARSFTGVSHLVYAAVHELPGLMPGWSDPVQIDTNGRMFANLLRPLETRLEHVTLLQGTKAYGSSVAHMRVPARERQPRVEHPNFYWVQEDLLRDTAARTGLAFTILRPQLVVGPNHGVVMNLPPVIGVYAAIRRAEGRPFGFPGGPEWVWEAADARLVGEACVWAAKAPRAWNEVFNLTNGEVFSFRDLWPAFARTLNVPVGPDEPVRLAEYLPARAHLWDRIVTERGLEPHSLAEILGESHHYADLCFATGAASPPPPVFVSTVKVREAGFNAVFDTETSFCHWLEDLVARRIIPRG